MNAPVFYDCEASDLDGYPIEIGWASVDQGSRRLISEAHLIRPPPAWPVKLSWTRAAEKMHGILFEGLLRDGRPVAEIALRMNQVLAGRTLYSDDYHDERWLRRLFETAAVRPTFTVDRMNAKTLIFELAAERGFDAPAVFRAQAEALEIEPRRHRAEPDARRLAATWNILSR